MLYIDKKKIRCPRCGSSTIPAKAISGNESTFWLRCSRKRCQTYIDTYIPMDFQQDVHASSSRYIMVAGGYGSSKTTLLFKDDEKHILTVPHGRTLMGADTLPQLENTAKKDFENDFPIDFVKKYSVQKNQIVFHNGHELMYRPMNDEGNLRSLNLTRFHLVEASEIDYDNFVQLQTRLRNTAGVSYLTDEDNNIVFSKGKPIIESDVRKGVLESNPDAGWIREKFLLNSAFIVFYGPQTFYDIANPDENKTSFIIPTDANYHLPPNFKEEISKGKPEWWKRRYLYGSFDYAEGLVYTNIIGCMKKSTDAPLRKGLGIYYAIGMDYGISDNTHFVFLHIDPSNNMITVYDELVLNNRNISEISQEYFKKLDTIPRGQLISPVMDGKSFSKRADTDRGVLRTIGQMFAEQGAYFRPAQMDLESRILRVNYFIENKMLTIHKDKCPQLCAELSEYKFPEKSLEKNLGANADKPVDRRNHGVNAMEFILMDVPTDLKIADNKIYGADGRVISNREAVARNQYNPYAPVKQTVNNFRRRTEIRDLGDDSLW